MKPVAMKPVSESSPPTIRDVAQKAGVSPGTVSRVLNNSSLVSAATRERVLKVVEELDYHPNLMARRLSIGKTLRIGAIVPFFTRPAETERLRGVVTALHSSQYDLLIHNVESVEQRDEYFEQIPRRDHVDGLIVISMPPKDEQIPRLINSEVPIVFIDVHHPGISMFDRIIGDDVSGGKLATRYLINLGHQKIGFIGDIPNSPFAFTSSRDRYQGYQQALEEAHLQKKDAFIAFAEHGRYAAHLLAEEMLTLPDRPTAIFAASDTQAMGIMNAARNENLMIPEELSVVGYDDIEIAGYLGLTTVRQNLVHSGEKGVELLLERMINPQKEPVCVQIPNEFVVRSTTGPPIPK